MKPYKIPVIVGLLFSVVFYSCDDLLDPKAVSYTHMTLPTIQSV